MSTNSMEASILDSALQKSKISNYRGIFNIEKLKKSFVRNGVFIIFLGNGVYRNHPTVFIV